VGNSSERPPRADTSEERDAKGFDSLEDAARGSLEDARVSLRQELGREPSDEEANEWLRRHTEGY
jgi:DNA-directed RNA polymerase specialized sigma subunit